jgi:putative ABC transport system permease protein
VGDSLVYTNADGFSIRGIIYGFFDYWPTYSATVSYKDASGAFQRQRNLMIVANLGQIQNTWGVKPYQIWMEAEGSTQFIYDYAAKNGVYFSVFQDTSAELIKMKNDPVFQGTNGVLTVGFVVILLLCTTGFLIYWILSIHSRTLQFGIFRAMGMTMREILAMLVTEQLFISGTAIGVGVVVGKVCSKLYIPLIQLVYSASDRAIPLEIITNPSDDLRLGIVIGLMIVLCMVILGVLISRIKITQALKLGED